MNMRTLEIEYFYDPLCGWCYASAPALDAIANAYPAALRMRPSGLFGGAGARPTSSIAAHSWENAQRIVRMTGQQYTTTYRDNVLRKAGALFDSTHTTRAIEAAGEIDGRLEPRMLAALQRARYVDAKDTSEADAVAAVAITILSNLNLPGDEAAFAARLVHDERLAVRTSRRIAETVKRMRTFPAIGVPVVLITEGEHRGLVYGADLYGGENVILRAIERVRSGALLRA